MKPSAPDPSVKAKLEYARSPIGKAPPSQTAPKEVPPGTTVPIKDIEHRAIVSAVSDIDKGLSQSVPQQVGPALTGKGLSSLSDSADQKSTGRERKHKAGDTSVTPVMITERDEGSGIDIPAGEVLQVSLHENPTTGFRWSIELLDNSLIQFRGDSFSNQATAVGGGGVRTFNFLAVRRGTTDLRLGLARQWEPTKEPGKKVSFKLRIV
jgi:inhibitor of cysteine peptidase